MHDPIFNEGQFREAIHDEAAELQSSATSDSLPSMLEELIDTFGWMEAYIMGVLDSSFSDADVADYARILSALEAAMASHRAKCANRELRPLSRTYVYLKELVAFGRACLSSHYAKEVHRGGS